MILCHLSIRNVVEVIQILLLQITLGHALPTVKHKPTAEFEAQNSVQTVYWDHHNKRALGNDAIPKIAGGAVGIVAFGLILGLGSASIAVFGSVEWQGYRGKKKEEKQNKQAMENEGKRENSDSDSDIGSFQ